MNGGIAPFLLIAATMGLMLGLAGVRLAAIGAALYCIAAVAAFALPVLLPLAIVFGGLFLSLIATAVLTYFKPLRWRPAVLPLSINCGAWAGACAALTSNFAGLATGFSPILLALPVHWAAQRNFTIIVKIVGSWMVAIASLSLFVSLMPTPGYEPDHME